MSIKLVSQVNALRGVRGRDRSVLKVLAEFAGDDGDRCFPSVAVIAERDACSARTVKRTLTDLHRAGYIEPEGERTGGAPGSATRWRLRVERWALLPTEETGDKTGRERGDKTGQTGDKTGLSRVTKSAGRGDKTGQETGDKLGQRGDTGDTRVVREWSTLESSEELLVSPLTPLRGESGLNGSVTRAPDEDDAADVGWSWSAPCMGCGDMVLCGDGSAPPIHDDRDVPLLCVGCADGFGLAGLPGREACALCAGGPVTRTIRTRTTHAWLCALCEERLETLWPGLVAEASEAGRFQPTAPDPDEHRRRSEAAWSALAARSPDEVPWLAVGFYGAEEPDLARRAGLFQEAPPLDDADDESADDADDEPTDVADDDPTEARPPLRVAVFVEPAAVEPVAEPVRAEAVAADPAPTYRRGQACWICSGSRYPGDPNDARDHANCDAELRRRVATVERPAAGGVVVTETMPSLLDAALAATGKTRDGHLPCNRCSSFSPPEQIDADGTCRTCREADALAAVKARR